MSSFGCCVPHKKGDKEATKRLETLHESMKTCEENEKGELSTWVEVIRRLDKHAETVFAGYKDCIQDMSTCIRDVVKYVLRERDMHLVRNVVVVEER